MRRREVRVGGARVRWHAGGEGPPLVLVHGLSGSWRWWGRVLPALAERYECHLLDVPRFGAAFRPQATAEWLAAWRDAAALDRPRLVGHSLGGEAAARLAALEPERVEALALVSAVGMPSGRHPLALAPPLLALLGRTRPPFLLRLVLDALRTGPAALLRGAGYAARADLREQTAAIVAPTLLVWGSRDRVVPLRLAEEWQRLLPAARLVVLEGAGHLPMVERPRELAEALLEFLDQPP